jgi:CBS domain-containing protein
MGTGLDCPSCGFENIAGEDRCAKCFHSLMQRDLPRPKKDDAFQRTMMTTPVSELVTGKDLLVASEEDTVAQVVEVLQAKNCKCLLVYQKKKLVGILSNRDLIRKMAAPDKDLSQVKVGKVMTPNPEFVRADEPIAVVVNKMALGGFRNVPVLSLDGAPLSILSIKDVLIYLSHCEKTDN